MNLCYLINPRGLSIAGSQIKQSLFDYATIFLQPFSKINPYPASIHSIGSDIFYCWILIRFLCLIYTLLIAKVMITFVFLSIVSIIQ